MNLKKRILRSTLFVVLLCPSVFAQTVVRLDPSTTEVHYTVGTLLHTVHGTFKLTSGVIQFDSKTGSASGQIVIDASSGDSGNKSRDNRMNNDVLETKKYPTISFTAQQVVGTVAPGQTSNVQLKGAFEIHGQKHELVLPVTVQPIGNAILAQTKFDVPYVDWGMKNPSTLFLTVNKSVEISIDARGKIEAAQAQSASASKN